MSIPASAFSLPSLAPAHPETDRERILTIRRLYQEMDNPSGVAMADDALAGDHSALVCIGAILHTVGKE